MFRVRVGIPHFFREEPSGSNPGYGSSRVGNKFARATAFARSLGSFLALNCSSRDWILNISRREMDLAPHTFLQSLQDIHVEVHVFVCGDFFIKDVINLYSARIKVHRVNLEKPVELPLAVVRYLLDTSDPADMTIYAEDDLIVQDSQFIDKLVWFHEVSNHQYILMPHRRELAVARAPQNLYVDGPISLSGQATTIYSNSESVVFSECYRVQPDISFVEASNPHSGMFCIMPQHLEKIRDYHWPPTTFISPLETAATGVLLPHFPILKPSWTCRRFFQIEHGNPSFLSYLGKFPENTSI